MFNRRQLRIKVLHILYAFHVDKGGSVTDAHKLLHDSLEKTYDLYLLLLMLIGEFQDAAIERIEAGRMKKQPTPEDLHPNTKFVNNKPLRVIIKSKSIAKEAANRKLGWGQEQDLVKKLFKSLVASEEYAAYMDNKERELPARQGVAQPHVPQAHCQRRGPAGMDRREEHSVERRPGFGVFHRPQDGQDHRLRIQTTCCFRACGRKRATTASFWRTCSARPWTSAKEHDARIEKAASNWDLDRIAAMDLILLRMALAEARTFETIPLKVTMNEYIDLAKFYSTEKSGAFVNGVLDKLFTAMREDGTIVKTGRGLIE